MWKWNWKPPCQRRDESSPKLTPTIFASYLMPETGVLTRTYFASCQVPDCPDVTYAYHKLTFWDKYLCSVTVIIDRLNNKLCLKTKSINSDKKVELVLPIQSKGVSLKNKIWTNILEKCSREQRFKKRVQIKFVIK